jgi:hypothetical protein
VRNLRTGRIVHRPATGPLNTYTTHAYKGPEPGDYVGVGPAVDIVVRRSGSVAWIAQNFGLDKLAAGYEVHVLDKRGSRVLAASPAINPSSLALTGSTIRWTQAGKRFSASLN